MRARSHTHNDPDPNASRLVYDMIDAYDDWFDEAVRVRNSYSGWLAATRDDAACAFAAYASALDREESAARHYRETASRLGDAAAELRPLSRLTRVM